MNLDHLIGKYLDGELTSSEDKTLREMIGADAVAREAFDSAVEIHMALREDAQSIELPKGLAQETEDLVLMRILSADSFIAEREEPKRAAYLWRTTMVAAMLALFMIGGSLTIFDSKIPELRGGANLEQASIASPENSETRIAIAENSNSQIATLSTLNRTRTRTTTSENETASLNTGSFANADKSMPGSSPTDAATFEMIAPAAISSESVSETFSQTEITNSEYEAGSKNAILEPKSSIAAMSAMPYSQTETEPFPIARGEFNAFGQAVPKMEEIQLSSFYGTDFMRNGINTADDQPIVSFSQSVAYSLDSKSRVGLEVGMISFQTNQKMMIVVPSSSKSSGLEEFIPGGDPTNYVSDEVDVTRDQKIFWGSAFYERTLIASGDASVESRLGAGVSRDGMIGFGRLFAKYEIVKGLSLTGGAEGKLFQANPNRFMQAEPDWKSTLSIIYGLQFNF